MAKRQASFTEQLSYYFKSHPDLIEYAFASNEIKIMAAIEKVRQNEQAAKEKAERKRARREARGGVAA